MQKICTPGIEPGSAATSGKLSTPSPPPLPISWSYLTTMGRFIESEKETVDNLQMSKHPFDLIVAVRPEFLAQA